MFNYAMKDATAGYDFIDFTGFIDSALSDWSMKFISGLTVDVDKQNF